MWHLARSLTAWDKLHFLSVLTWLSLSESLAGTFTCMAPAPSPAAAAPLSPLLLLHQSSITLAVLIHTHSDQKEHSGLNQIKIGFNENTEQIGVIKCRQGSGKHPDLPFLYSFFFFPYTCSFPIHFNSFLFPLLIHLQHPELNLGTALGKHPKTTCRQSQKCFSHHIPQWPLYPSSCKYLQVFLHDP